MKDFCMDEWLKEYVRRVKDCFNNRIEFIGIQGSFARGEATQSSDIDVVLLLDTFSYEDLKKYENAIKDMEYREKVCGFISGIREMENWNRADLFTFYYDTKPLYGNMDWLGERIEKSDILNAVNRDVCDIYHLCVHNGIHEKSGEILKALLKKAVFVLRAKYFYKTGVYIQSKSDMMKALDGDDWEILILSMKPIQEIDFNEGTQSLMEWAGNLIKQEGF